MNVIKMTHKPIWLGLIFTSGLASIPYGIIVATSQYIYDDKNLKINEGVFVKRQKIIPLYRIIDIQSRRNILGFGTVSITDKTGVTTLRLVSEPLEVARTLQAAREQAQSHQNIIHNEIF